MEQKTEQINRIKIKKNRIMRYFIEAAREIVEKEGIKSVTIRKTANLAGYTSATLYNYFNNLEHLVFLAVLDHLEEYNKSLEKSIEICENSVEFYLAVCECFVEYSCKDAETFKLLFFSHGEKEFEKYVEQYYELFPEKSKKNKSSILDKILHTNSIYSRSYAMLERCVKEEYFEEEKAKDFNEVSLRFNRTILDDIIDEFLDVNEAKELTLKYYFQLINLYIKPEYRKMVDSYKNKNFKKEKIC